MRKKILVMFTIIISLNFGLVFKKLISNIKASSRVINLEVSTSGPIGYSKDLLEYEKTCIIATRTLNENEDSKLLCPCISNYLVGKQKFVKENILLHNNQTYNVSLGGGWSPPCVARQNVAIIIPFRDRDEHLKILLSIIHPFLQRQLIKYTIFVVEQASPNVFNKASLMNVGFLVANLTDKFNCFIFHDVDMIPEDDRNIYMCGEQPIHIGVYVDKWNYKMFYDQIFGGVTAFRRWHFEKVNGFSNQFYGWGGEDDEMAKRVLASNLQVARRLKVYCRYSMIKHTKDKRNPYNKKSGGVWKIGKKDRKKILNDGLTNLRYLISDKQLLPLYTWILVDLPPDRLTDFNI